MILCASLHLSDFASNLFDFSSGETMMTQITFMGAGSAVFAYEIMTEKRLSMH